MLDAQLHLEINLPQAGATVNSGTLDLGVDTSTFSDQWRLGRLTVNVPALPANVNGGSFTVTLQDSGDGGATFQTTNPLIQIQVAGVANTGSAAATIDMPLPPGLRGPIQLQLAVPANGGSNVAQLLTADWNYR